MKKEKEYVDLLEKDNKEILKLKNAIKIKNKEMESLKEYLQEIEEDIIKLRG